MHKTTQKAIIIGIVVLIAAVVGVGVWLYMRKVKQANDTDTFLLSMPYEGPGLEPPPDVYHPADETQWQMGELSKVNDMANKQNW